MKIVQMEVNHFTGKLMAKVEYRVTEKVGLEYGDGRSDIELLSITSPTTNWDLTQFDGVSQDEKQRMKAYLAELEASLAVKGAA